MEDGPLVSRFTVDVTHKDGTPVPDDKSYFVLDISSPDEREKAAMVAFVEACERTGYRQLAADLRAAVPIPEGKIRTVRAYLNLEPGYVCPLRWDQQQDLADLMGSVEGEFDGYKPGDKIRAMWDDSRIEEMEFAAFLAKAQEWFRAIQLRGARSRLIVWTDDDELMFLSETISLAEWELSAGREFIGW